MARHLTVVLVIGLAASASAQEQRTMRFAGMDADNDGVITQREWRGSPRAFQMQDWNGDGVLSGDEVRPRANQRRATARDRADAFDDWTADGFARLDRNGDRRVAREEWRADPETFRRADDNGDGVLSRREFLGEAGPDADEQEDGDRPYQDTNRDGRVSRSEWQGTAERFDLLDANRDGQLTSRELSGGSRPDPDAFLTADTNEDGWITADEWRGAQQEFRRRDANGDRRLTRQEFAGVPVQANSEAWRQGRDRGLIEGRQAGKEDKERNQGWDLDGQRELETADSGYSERFGSRTEYQSGYREGFRRGYREGYGPR